MATIKRTIIPRSKGRYLSFPTMVEYKGKIYIFYREGVTDNQLCHGFDGRVRSFIIEKQWFLSGFKGERKGGLHMLGTDTCLFQDGNEFDAICSKLEDNLFSLASRSYKDNRMKTFISFNDEPIYKERQEVKVRGITSFAFYGKGFKWREGYVFPAYGWLKNEETDRPLLLVTEDLKHFELLSYLPTDINGSILNESSVIEVMGRFLIFVRDDAFPFGIWYSASSNLEHWEEPQQLYIGAHAPMAIYYNGQAILACRDLTLKGRTGITILKPFLKFELILDTYRGNPYDGGYTDLCVIDGQIYCIYYKGNPAAEPYIICARVDI